MKQPRFEPQGSMQRESERRSNAALALASLVAHLLLLLLFPGVVLPPATPPTLVIRLSQPSPDRTARIADSSKPIQGLEPQVPGGLGARSLDPQDGQAAVRQSAPGSNPHPSRPAGAAGQIVPQNSAPRTAGPVALPQTGPTSDATDIDNPAPRVVPQSPQETAVPPKPEAEREDARPAPPASKPDTAPSSKPQESNKPDGPPQGRPDQPGAPGVAKPAPETGKPDSNPNQGQGSGPSPDPGDGSGNTPGAPNNQGPAGRTAPDFGAPAIPAGPGDAELAVLGSYGDHCMNEIKKQARNPERAREKFKGQKDNWGTVSFEFEVSKTGKLLDVRITSDGGYAPFGDEVEEATRIASRYFGGWSKYGVVASVESWTFKRKLKFPLY